MQYLRSKRNLFIFLHGICLQGGGSEDIIQHPLSGKLQWEDNLISGSINTHDQVR